METYFAPPERTNNSDLVTEIDIIDRSPIVTGLLHSISGMLAVLDEHRQVVALNSSFLSFLGIDDPSAVLGLRHGEAVHCIHGYEEPSGCGTTKYCSTCGAAVAIVSSLKQDKPVERICSLTANRNGTTVDIALLVRSYPILIEQKRFLLLFIQDISIQQQRAALERTFFHDINNMLSGMVGLSEQLSQGESDPNLADNLFQVSLRMRKEVEIQKCLLHHGRFSYVPTWHETSSAQVMAELQSIFSNHSAAAKKILCVSISSPLFHFQSDLSLLLRVLCNMITNALEATDENGTVKVWSEQALNMFCFCVWNDKIIPEDIALRIFQRNFSTKDGDGRGIGTYSMKLFGETILGGKVCFASSIDEGTTFRISFAF